MFNRWTPTPHPAFCGALWQWQRHWGGLWCPKSTKNRPSQYHFFCQAFIGAQIRRHQSEPSALSFWQQWPHYWTANPSRCQNTDWRFCRYFTHTQKPCWTQLRRRTHRRSHYRSRLLWWCPTSSHQRCRQIGRTQRVALTQRTHRRSHCLWFRPCFRRHICGIRFRRGNIRCIGVAIIKRLVWSESHRRQQRIRWRWLWPPLILPSAGAKPTLTTEWTRQPTLTQLKPCCQRSPHHRHQHHTTSHPIQWAQSEQHPHTTRIS